MAGTGLTEQGWRPVGLGAEIGGVPAPVTFGGRTWLLVRLTADAVPTAFVSHCPHRLVPLSAAAIVDGTLQCAYHGWRFGPDGRCAEIPSLGPDVNIPPRAHLARPPEVREQDGQIWLRAIPSAERPTSAAAPHPEPTSAAAAAAAAQPDSPGREITNLSPALRHAWHPVALISELGAQPRTVRLLGADWDLKRAGGGVQATPEPYGVLERWGLVWLAPERPLDELFDDPDAEDREYVGEWLPPSRTNVAAGLVADNFLDVAHFPFVHAATFGPDTTMVEPYEVQLEPHGFRSIQVQPFDNPEDPGVATGERPLRQRRRATYVYRAPFQLLLRLEELEAGAVKTILFFAQPEDLASTRIYTKMLLHGIGGTPRPGPDVVAREVAFEEAVLAEDLALQTNMDATGLPLDLRDELHVRADRLGVALRRELRAFLGRSAGLHAARVWP